MTASTPPKPGATTQASSAPPNPNAASGDDSPARKAEKEKVEKWNKANPSKPPLYVSTNTNDSGTVYSDPKSLNPVGVLPTEVDEPIWLTPKTPPPNRATLPPNYRPGGSGTEGTRLPVHSQSPTQSTDDTKGADPAKGAFCSKGNPVIDPKAKKEDPSWGAMQKALKTEGSPKERMKAVQETLLKAGYKIQGGADGLYGPSTQAALADYLHKCGQDDLAKNVEGQNVSAHPPGGFDGQTVNGLRILEGQAPIPERAQRHNFGAIPDPAVTVPLPQTQQVRLPPKGVARAPGN